MRHRSFRNPQYAPEMLERKLSPSDIAVAPPPADVTTVDTTATAPAPTDTTVVYVDAYAPVVPSDGSDGPILVPPMPNGPTGPAVA